MGLLRGRWPVLWSGTVLWIVMAMIAPSLAVADSSTTGRGGEPTESRSRGGVLYERPVRRVVVDGFRMANGPYGGGNRGLEYATVRGDVVVAVASGIVTYAGFVVDRYVITIRHSDGRLSSLSRMLSIEVATGAVVLRGQRIGLADVGLHLGIRQAGQYIDPAQLLTRQRTRARLVPVGLTPGN